MGGVAAAVSVFVQLNQFSQILSRQCCLGPPFNTARAYSGHEKVRYAERSCWETNCLTINRDDDEDGDGNC